ncbi:MAG TPA: diphthine synthase [Nanoarchaeota archaeon]|nr:diphthine synthase [Nanoarchaeota archaeon]
MLKATIYFMLYLIGLGFDEKDITLKGIEAGKKCEKCYAELYTSDWKGDIKNIEKLIGKEIKILERSDLEENLDIWINEIKDYNTALFVPGDPLVATTHIAIVDQALRKGIKVKIIHAPSIISAIASCGLQIYKFGKTATIPWSGQVENVAKTIEFNKQHGLHTLLLLDIGMSGEQGLKILLSKNIITEDTDIIVASNLGRENEKILFCKAKEIKNFPSPCVIIIPGKLHFAEKEFLELLRCGNDRKRA